MRKLFLIFLLIITKNTFAQAPDLGKGVFCSIEMSGAFSDGTHAPFWLTANRYGISSIERNSGYVRGGAFRDVMGDSTRHWDLGYGADVVVPSNYTSAVFLQQLYTDLRWQKGTLTIGQKQHPMQLKNNELSSGSQTFGINAHPYPEIRLALPDYWVIPGTRGVLSIKGHLAWGMLTDGNFQKDFTNGLGDYDQDVLICTRAGYLKIGKDSKPFSAEMGLEMATQFGSTHYKHTSNGYKKIKNGRGLRSFWHAFCGGGKDSMDGATPNNEGNTLGSWVLRLNYDTKRATLGVYADHFFEDHSAMFQLDYDGYVYKDGHMKREKNSYLLYPLKDIMLGGDVHFKKSQWLSDIVVEYIYTRYQSGAVYTDRNPLMPDHIGGNDNYYNNALEPGWQHWGQSAGNPFFLSPVYNTDSDLSFQCNRFTAWHIGIAGLLSKNLHYRLRASWQEGLGTYDMPFINPRRNVSIGLETRYHAHQLYKGLHIGAAFGFDRGELMGNNTGGAITLTLKR